MVARKVSRCSAVTMKIAVIGSGAIGGLVAGYLKHRKADVFLVGRGVSFEAIKKEGLFISGTRGELKVPIDIYPHLGKRVDLVILAVKTQDEEKTIKENLEYLKYTTILTTQNGVQADNILARHISKKNIISSIVMFGSTYLGGNKIAQNFEGRWILGRPFSKNDEMVQQVSAALSAIFPVIVSDDILGMKWLKIFVNANNALAAIIGKSMQETFKDLKLCKISMRLWQEGLKVVNSAGIKLESLPDFPLERLIKLTSLPLDESAKIFSQIMVTLSREPLYGSILQSLKRDRLSEIDYINGEFVSLGKACGVRAALNERLVSLVHKVERTRKFLSEEELLDKTKEFLN